MMKYDKKFLRNKDGIISIEFAACFFIFSILVFIIYDIYSSIMLQSRLERVNYAISAIFRERSSIYPIIDDTQSGNNDHSLCRVNGHACFNSYELFNDGQIEQLQLLASSLLDRPVAIKVDALFILQDANYPKDLTRALLLNINGEFCPEGACNGGINNYFNSLPSMTDNSTSSVTNYSKLVPYVPRMYDANSGLSGRWIPLYRVSMCVVNEESLYLKWINSNRHTDQVFPNLCSNSVVLSRCNDIFDADSTACPIYLR